MAGHAKSPALKSDTGELFAGCEKLDLFCIFNGRGGQIRTDDPLLPKQMRYQAALRPDFLQSYLTCAAENSCLRHIQSPAGSCSKWADSQPLGIRLGALDAKTSGTFRNVDAIIAI